MNFNEITERIGTLPEDPANAVWRYGLEFQKSGEEIQVRYSDEILPLFEIMEGITSFQESENPFKFVVIVTFPSDSYSRTIDGQEVIPFGNYQQIIDAVERERNYLKDKANLQERAEAKSCEMRCFSGSRETSFSDVHENSRSPSRLQLRIAG